MKPRPMRLSAVASEAWRNVTSATTRTMLLLAMAAGGFTALAVADSSAIGQLRAQAIAFRDSGAAVLILDAPGLINGASCDRLAQVEGIPAAGALRPEPDPLLPTATPRQSIPIFAASPGFDLVISTDLDVGVTLSQDAAEQYVVSLPARLATANGPVIVGGTYTFPDDGRNPALTYAALVRASMNGEPFDACWAVVWPYDPGKQVLLYTAITGIPPQQADITINQLNSTLGTTFDGERLLAQRITRHVPLVAAALGLLLAVGSARLRRLELASARHLGVTRLALSFQLLIEAALWVLTAAVAAAVASIAVGAVLDVGGAAMALGIRAIVAGSAGALAGAIFAGTLTSPRHLVAYFKQR